MFVWIVLENMKREEMQIVGETRRENRAIEKTVKKKADKKYSLRNNNLNKMKKIKGVSKLIKIQGRQKGKNGGNTGCTIQLLSWFGIHCSIY